MKKILNNKGLTLVEIIITLSVLSIVIGPLIGMFITSQKINNESDKEYRSIQLAQKYMEDIKAMDRLDTTDYVKTIDGSNTIYTKTIPETADNYGVEIEIKSGLESEDDEDDIDFDATMTIETNTVKYLLSGDTLPYIRSLLGDIDIIIKDTGVKIEAESEIGSPLSSNKIKVVLKEDATINIANELEDTVKLYIFNVDEENIYECNINVLEGEVQKINNNSITPIEKSADNILYYITITIKKGAEKINTLTGTTIFKYKPI